MPTVVPIKTPQADAIEFLEKFARDFPAGTYVSISAITPDGPINTKTAPVGEEESLRPFIEKNISSRNLYFSVNPVQSDLNKKAEKKNIAAVNYLHVDIDPRAGHDLAAERERILRLLEDFRPKPSALIDSGGGYQAFWKLSKPVTIIGNIGKLERYNKALEQAFNADACSNIDRIMRLPGTTNFPTKTKRKKGRTETAPTVLVYFDDDCYDLSNFDGLLSSSNTKKEPKTAKLPDQLPEVVVEELPLRADVKRLIQKGDTAGKYKSRSEAFLAVVGAMYRVGCEPKTIAAVCLDRSNAISGHPLDQEEPRRVIIRAIAKIKDADATLIRGMNARHGVVMVGGKVAILTKVKEPITNHETFTLSSPTDMRAWYENQRLGRKTKFDFWMQHPDRRTLKGIVFSPKSNVPDYYNLWRGFAVKPKKGDCKLILRHIRDNIAQGVDDVYDYLIAWMADAVQNPETRPGTAIALRGPQGVGKGVFAHGFGSLFGQHFVHVTQVRHLLGNFNSHLRYALLVFGDECFWAGDRPGEGVIKAMVTEPVIQIEFKGKDAFPIKNLIRLIIASNKEWVVPTALEERRFFVLDVGIDRLQDHVYFGAIEDQMNAGGREALLHYLLRYDLTGINLRSFPQTEALWEQKLLSMSPLHRFWFERLWAGSLDARLDDWDDGRIPKETLLNQYLDVIGKGGERYKKSVQTEFGIALKKLVGDGLKSKRIAWLKDDKDNTTRRAVYEFPPLAECRAIFERAAKTTRPWPEAGAATKGVERNVF